VPGHEVKIGGSVVGSSKNSQVDSKEKKKMNDFDGIDLPMHLFHK